MRLTAKAFPKIEKLPGLQHRHLPETQMREENTWKSSSNPQHQAGLQDYFSGIA
jgi:hypothetical protein